MDGFEQHQVLPWQRVVSSSNGGIPKAFRQRTLEQQTRELRLLDVDQ